MLERRALQHYRLCLSQALVGSKPYPEHPSVTVANRWSRWGVCPDEGIGSERCEDCHFIVDHLDDMQIPDVAPLLSFGMEVPDWSGSIWSMLDADGKRVYFWNDREETSIIAVSRATSIHRDDDWIAEAFLRPNGAIFDLEIYGGTAPTWFAGLSRFDNDQLVDIFMDLFSGCDLEGIIEFLDDNWNGAPSTFDWLESEDLGLCESCTTFAWNATAHYNWVSPEFVNRVRAMIPSGEPLCSACAPYESIAERYRPEAEAHYRGKDVRGVPSMGKGAFHLRRVRARMLELARPDLDATGWSVSPEEQLRAKIAAAARAFEAEGGSIRALSRAYLSTIGLIRP